MLIMDQPLEQLLVRPCVLQHLGYGPFQTLKFCSCTACWLRLRLELLKQALLAEHVRVKNGCSSLVCRVE